MAFFRKSEVAERGEGKYQNKTEWGKEMGTKDKFTSILKFVSLVNQQLRE